MASPVSSPENDLLDAYDAPYHAPIRLHHTWRDYLQVVIERIWIPITVLALALVGAAVW